MSAPTALSGDHEAEDHAEVPRQIRGRELERKRLAVHRVGHEPAQQQAVVAHEASDDVRGRAQRFDGTRVVRCGQRELGEHPVVELREQRAHELLLRAEVVVEHPEVDARMLGDASHRQRAHSEARIELASGGEERGIDVARGTWHAVTVRPFNYTVNQ